MYIYIEFLGRIERYIVQIGYFHTLSINPVFPPWNLQDLVEKYACTLKINIFKEIGVLLSTSKAC